MATRTNLVAVELPKILGQGEAKRNTEFYLIRKKPDYPLPEGMFEIWRGIRGQMLVRKKGKLKKISNINNMNDIIRMVAE